MNRVTVLRATVVTCLLAASTVSGAAAADSARVGSLRTETPVNSSGPADGVTETVVSVRLPLPASVGVHPAACDWLSYLRFRDSAGPADATAADRILVAQPGVLEGAGAFDSVARNTVAAAAKQGQHIEFWALDRRSNCLEDHAGIRAALAAGDPTIAVDYYYRGKVFDGHTFGGYLTNGQVGWLAKIGLEQTVRDEYKLLVHELPSQQLRKQRVLCGGHSLGGVITGFFAEWDFDGDHSTTADAGFNQCAGYFALDTTISTGLSDLSGATPTGDLPDPGLGYAAVQAGLQTGLLTRTLSGPAVINAETMNFLGIAGVFAKLKPQQTASLLQSLPQPNLNIETTSRVLFSKDLATFILGKPSVKDFRFTNETVLGALMDDNSQPLSILQTSVGFFDGGRVADKDFPLSSDALTDPALASLRGLFGTRPLAIPDQPNGPLYTWRNYNRVGAPDDPGYRNSDGQPYTSADQEVTDIQELARSMSEQPLDFTEHYFPTKLITDIQQAGAPEVSRDVIYRDGLTANPTITLLAGDGIIAGDGSVPAELHAVVAPGYQHLDVLTAAATQNNGRPEVVSTNLAAFARRPL
ncbi:MAG TPA: hypothetical protein VLL08_33095 [Kineosporiaceae bacterium]|nr:hypothetical protein [Kineosporiaceae bacterium]